jgi:threonine synthase
VATAFAEGAETFRPVREPNTIARSLAIGNPADGRYALELARRTGGSIEAVGDAAIAAAIRQLASREGIFAETAGGVTIAAAAQARAAGIIGPDEETVAIISGNGLKTPDAPSFGIEERVAGPGRPGLAPVLPASLGAFEAWLSGQSA